MKTIVASGNRKSAIAKAFLKEGNGVVRINTQLLDTYTPEVYKIRISEPFLLAGESAQKVDIMVQVNGGGINSQADAARLAIAKALFQYNKKLQKEFSKYDRTLLVADVRQKETHKPNRHGKARAKQQKSYR
ncbi:30S ribosomal protein S9 [Candidatus Woesearchaeota archaeon]|nr:30S ribosomal protein S9 [Candidatus Woesearchaeota archaeon]